MSRSRNPIYQATFPGFGVAAAAVERIAAAPVEGHGAIFTRREVADFILDLIGYTSNEPLAERRLLEPSFRLPRLICVWSRR